MTTYYCDWNAGSDANAGTSEGSGNAWKSADKAEGSVSGGDTVYFKDNGTYLNDGHTRVLTTAVGGSAGSPIKFIGYTTTPGDGGQCTWSGGGSDNRVMYSNTAGHDYRWFENIRFTNTGSNGTCQVRLGENTVFVNCRFDLGAVYGMDGTAPDVVVFGCQSDNNATGGIAAQSGVVMGHLSEDDGSYGIHKWDFSVTGTEGGSNLIAFNVVHGHVASVGIKMQSQDDGRFPGVFAHNTIDGENAASAGGFSFGGSGLGNTGSIFLNNVVYDVNNGFGASDISRASAHFQNIVNSNTDDYATYGDDFDVSGNDLTGAPTFVDETAHDYTPAADSAAYGTAMDLTGVNSGRDIGAIPAPIRGVRRPTAMTGGMG